jgi:regulating synaptic membrane exocytosis protein 2
MGATTVCVYEFLAMVLKYGLEIDEAKDYGLNIDDPSCLCLVSPILGQSGQWQQEVEGYERPHVLVTSPGSPERPRPSPSLAPSVGGRIQIRLGFDPTTLQLLVTIVCAAGLTPRSPHQPRNPYCKLFLLPDRSEKSKRRTRTLAGKTSRYQPRVDRNEFVFVVYETGTTEPMWNQTFVYSGLRRADLRQRALEITVWDYVRYGANDFLGESIVELWPLDEQPTWRTLGPHEEVALTPSEHLSPPSTGSRFSDSDTPSECEIDGGRERRGADGASVSSVGSSASPPRDNERKSRRDQETMHASYTTTQGYRRVSRELLAVGCV